MAARDLPGFIAWPPLGTPMTAEQIAQTRAALNVPAFIQGLRAAAPSIDVPPGNEGKQHDGHEHQGIAGSPLPLSRPDRDAGGRRRVGTRNTAQPTAAKAGSGT